jgi:iron complex transport system ATP-binding protein
VIALADATVRFGRRTILDRLSFSVGLGQTLAILGPNGRGKSTALRALLGVQPMASGRRQAPATLGYVPQTSGFSQAYSVLDVVLMGRSASLGLFGQPTPQDRERAEEALSVVGMAAFADHAIDRLSGGERQMVLLARALATGSPALLLDEPGSALDLRNQQRLLALLRRLGEEGRHAILFTTHDPNHALAAATDALLMMDDGRVEAGPVEEVLTADHLEALYGVAMQRVPAPSARRGHVLTPVLG